MSLCNYCGKDIVWIQKPAGGWFPPFDLPAEFENLAYEVFWADPGDWVAEPVDREFNTKLTRHKCERYYEILEIRRQKILNPPVDEPEPEKIIQYVEVPRYRNPSPESYIKIAQRLQEDCPTCYAGPFEWCTYVGNPGKLTGNLHTTRRV